MDIFRSLSATLLALNTLVNELNVTLVSEFRGKHFELAKVKLDRQTDRQTNRQTDRRMDKRPKVF